MDSRLIVVERIRIFSGAAMRTKYPVIGKAKAQLRAKSAMIDGDGLVSASAPRNVTVANYVESTSICLWSVSRGPACVLEGLSQAFARVLPDRALSGGVEPRED